MNCKIRNRFRKLKEDIRMNKAEKIISVIILGAWVIFPDFIPGPIDDVLAVIMTVHQVCSIIMPAPTNARPAEIKS